MPEVTSLTSSPTVTFLTLYLPASASFPSAPRPLHHLLTFVVLQGSMILTHTSPPSPSSVLFSVRKSCNLVMKGSMHSGCSIHSARVNGSGSCILAFFTCLLGQTFY